MILRRQELGQSGLLPWRRHGAFVGDQLSVTSQIMLIVSRDKELHIPNAITVNILEYWSIEAYTNHGYIGSNALSTNH